MSVLRPDLMMKCVIPVIMAGIIAIYGLVVSVLISGDLQTEMTLFQGFVQLGAGLSVGLAGLAAGFAIGIVGDAGVRGTAQQPRLFVGMILILIFAEVLGLYGLIVALIMNSRGAEAVGKVSIWPEPSGTHLIGRILVPPMKSRYTERMKMAVTCLRSLCRTSSCSVCPSFHVANIWHCSSLHYIQGGSITAECLNVQCESGAHFHSTSPTRQCVILRLSRFM
ncbi:hypothetical protein IEO21_07004 [Rhodonia placenta]|uniref:V-type proton ATPase proteolipid subunit n=1 Tax=Rhodonia placenta TaxID=104341 RepID=A0A8H7NYZ9_9APHY|nr:hypothetical protein IEO21_07004 [Postia placenta]